MKTRYYSTYKYLVKIVQICNRYCLFIKEVYFRKVGSRSSGRLFDKYYNTLKRLKKNGEWTCSNNNNNSVNLLENNSPLLDCNEEAGKTMLHPIWELFS